MATRSLGIHVIILALLLCFYMSSTTTHSKPPDDTTGDGNPADGHPADSHLPDGRSPDDSPLDGNPPDGNQDDGKKEDVNEEDNKPLNGELDDGNKSNDGNPDDRNPDNGNSGDGNTLDGRKLDDEKLHGDTESSDTLDGDTLDGDTLDGDTLDGDTLDGGRHDGEKQDGETPKETVLNFVKPDDLLEQFGINHLTAEVMLAGRRPLESMMITQEDTERDYKDEKDPFASHTREGFYFSCTPYRPSAVVAYADSPWLLRQLKPITFDDMTLDTHHRGRSIRLTNTGYSRCQYGWMHCGVTDSDGNTGRIVLYNIRFDRAVETVLPHFAEFIVKEPYYTLHCDGKVVVRVDHPSDLIISSPYTICMKDEGGLLAYPTESPLKVDPRSLIEEALKVWKKEPERAQLWLRDAIWVATETGKADGDMESDYRDAQAFHASIMDTDDDFRYLRATAALGGAQWVPVKNAIFTKASIRELQEHAAFSAVLRGDFRTAMEHVDGLVNQGDIKGARELFEKLKLKRRQREQELGEYEDKDLTPQPVKEDRERCASFLKRVMIDNDKKCLRAACPIGAEGLISAESVFEWIHEESLYDNPESRDGYKEMERVGYFEGDGGTRTMLGVQAALVPAVLDKCMRFFVSTRERTSLFDEIPRDCKLQEPYDIFHIQEVVYRHAIQWETNPKDPAKSYQSAAIWPTSAYVRGSDNPNAKGWIINEMLFLRATRGIEQGEIITMREISSGNNLFLYKKGENYKGGDPEPFMPALPDAPPPPIIDPGAWLFRPKNGQEAGFDEDDLEVAKRILNIRAQLPKKQSEAKTYTKLMKQFSEKMRTLDKDAVGNKFKYGETIVFLMEMINKNHELAKKRNREVTEMLATHAQDLKKKNSNLRLKHLVKLLENPPK